MRNSATGMLCTAAWYPTGSQCFTNKSLNFFKLSTGSERKKGMPNCDRCWKDKQLAWLNCWTIIRSCRSGFDLPVWCFITIICFARYLISLALQARVKELEHQLREKQVENMYLRGEISGLKSNNSQPGQILQDHDISK